MLAVMTPPHRPLLHARGDTPEPDSLQALADHMRANTRVVPVGPRPLSEAFADVGNPTANGIYQRIGFQPLGEFVELDFV